MLTVVYKNRNHTARQQPVLRQTVSMLRWSVRGWCDKAEIRASGDYRDVGDLIELLRCPVEIWDEHGQVVWWGYANSVSYSRGAMRITYSLDTMFNSVKVAYSWIAPGTNEVGIRKTTAAATDTDSVGFYGTKELIHSAPGMTDTAATERRDNILAWHKYPRGTASGDGGSIATGGANNSAAGITIGCNGWWYTLGWRLAEVTKVGQSHGVSDGDINLGDAAARTKILQNFTIGTTGEYAVGATVRVAKVASPTDNLTMEIYALDGSGNPTGTALATGSSISGASISSAAFINLRDDFTTPVTLTANVQYGLVFARSGAIDGTNYYRVGVDTAGGYAGGVSKIYDGAAWGGAAGYDCFFRINVNPLMETSQQIKDLIVTYGALLDYGNVTIEDASGISTHANREGDTDALSEINALADMGYSDGGRMVCRVTQGRQVEIYKASSTATYKADSYNRIYNAQTNEPIQAHVPPIGSWIELADLMPETADASRLITPGLQYLEAYEWHEDGSTTPIYAGQEELQGALRA